MYDTQCCVWVAHAIAQARSSNVQTGCVCHTQPKTSNGQINDHAKGRAEKLKRQTRASFRPSWQGQKARNGTSSKTHRHKCSNRKWQAVPAKDWSLCRSAPLLPREPGHLHHRSIPCSCQNFHRQAETCITKAYTSTQGTGISLLDGICSTRQC